MKFNEYQQIAARHAIYPEHCAIEYASLGLASEAGEVCDKVKKCIRDNNSDFKDPEFREALAKELGDALWYISEVARRVGLSLDLVAAMNLAKLKDRADRQALQGSGDNR